MCLRRQQCRGRMPGSCQPCSAAGGRQGAGERQA
jgi:hypothetical protein